MKSQQASPFSKNINFSKEMILSSVPSKRVQSGSIKNRSKIITLFNENLPQSFNNLQCSKVFIKEQILVDEKNLNCLNNLCNEDCPNLQFVQKFKLEIKELVEANINLKKMNEYLIKTINLKDDLFLDVLNQNKNLKLDNNILNSHITSNRILSGRPIKIINNIRKAYFPETCDNSDNFKQNQKNGNSSISKYESNNLNFNYKIAHFSGADRNIKSNNNSGTNKRKESYNAQKILGFISQKDKKTPYCEFHAEENYDINSKGTNHTRIVKNPRLVNIISDSNTKNYTNKIDHSLSKGKSPNNNALNQNKNFNFYEKLANMINKNNKNMRYKNQARSSLLSFNDDMLYKLLANDIFINLKKITLNDEEFIGFFRSSSDEVLINYCDGIYAIIKDLESAIRLVQRMRTYIMITASLINCVLIEELSINIIKDACKLMDCDRTSIFIYDTTSDMLVVHTAEGLTRNDIRIPKNIGIIGTCFNKGEIIRVDDAYTDTRFSRDFDKKSNYITKTLLAAPLKDKHGAIFGVIQAINKNNNMKFTDDDEELIHLFSLHISQILKNATTNDENLTYIAKLKMIISFREELEKINNLVRLTTCIEEIVINIFSAQSAQFLIFHSEKNVLVHISKYEKSEKNMSLGIVGYVLDKKDEFCVNSSNNCTFYNNLVDIDSGLSILTYPILNNNKVKGILQFSYNEKLIHFKKPKEKDEQIIRYIIKDCEKWFYKNEEILKQDLNYIK